MILGFFADGDDQLTAVLQVHALGNGALFAQLVDQAGERAGIPAILVLVLLKTVQLLHHDQGDVNHVLVELEDRLGIEEQDVRVQDEILLQFNLRRGNMLGI